MDIAALILSLFAFAISSGCLILLLAKRFSTHRVEYLHPPTTTVEYEALGGGSGQTPTPAPLDVYEREQRLAALERQPIDFGDDF